MPHRFEFPGQVLAVLIALYEPVFFYLGAIAAATATTLGGPALVGGLPGPWAALAGYGVGVVVDLAARGRAYARLPEDRRKSRLREWKERLTWGAVGLGVGWALSILVTGYWSITTPAMAPYIHPFANFMCVLIAVPLIDLTRGTFRILAGQSTQQAFAGLVIDWVNRKAGKGGEGGS